MNDDLIKGCYLIYLTNGCLSNYMTTSDSWWRVSDLLVYGKKDLELTYTLRQNKYKNIAVILKYLTKDIKKKNWLKRWIMK